VHADVVRKMDKPEVEDRIVPSRGTHLVFKKGLFDGCSGIIIPQTSDGRLIYVINYMGHPMAGTTDIVTESEHEVKPDQSEIDFIINELKPYLGHDYDYQANLQSAWAGLRPLVKSAEGDAVLNKDDQSPTLKKRLSLFMQGRLRWLAFKVNGSKKKSTKALARNHVIETSESGLVSLMGGKWTAYRIQGEHCVDHILQADRERAQKEGNARAFQPAEEEGQTLNFNLLGSYSKVEVKHTLTQTPAKLFKGYEDHFVFEYSVPREVAKHLIETYGTSAIRVVKLGKENNMLERIHPDYPFCEAEILYAIREEMAQKPNDVACRRVPLAFLDEKIAKEVLLPKVTEILAKEKKWSAEKQA